MLTQDHLRGRPGSEQGLMEPILRRRDLLREPLVLRECPDEAQDDRDIPGRCRTDGESSSRPRGRRAHAVQRRKPIPEDEDAPGISPGHGWLIGAS